MKKITKTLAISVLSLILSGVVHAGEIPITSFASTQEYLDYLMSIDYAAYLAFLAGLV